jgi:hypothetical protein
MKEAFVLAKNTYSKMQNLYNNNFNIKAAQQKNSICKMAKR